MKDQGYYHPEVIARREQLKHETAIQNLLNIDKSVFIKTEEEKLACKLAKRNYKTKLRNYGQH